MSSRAGAFALAAVCVVVAASAGLEAVRARKDAGRLRHELAALRATTTEAERRGADPARDGARRQLPAASGSGAGGIPRGLLATATHLRRLREAGLPDPVAHLRADLQAHPELIPAEGTLGGRMGFYSPADIVLLNDRWVYAYFEDGHRAGSMLLAFDVQEGGEITWRRLDSMLW
ncbi:MAG: hypothetical protein ABR599_08315 [Gemmatimonadota bacterium]